MRTFVANENISRFRHQLENGGVEATARATLLGHLRHEEESLGRDRAQLMRVDRHIDQLQRLIANQLRLTENSDGADTERHRALLNTLNELMPTHQKHRTWLVAGLADAKA